MTSTLKFPVIACAVCLAWHVNAGAQDSTTSTELMLFVAEPTTASISDAGESTSTVPLEAASQETDTTASMDVQQAEQDVAVTTPESTSTATVAEDFTTTGAATSTTPDDTATSVTTPEGVAYQVLKSGTGPEKSSTQTLLLHYTLYVGGKKIESSRDAEFPMPLKLKRNTDSFIKGFEIGTQGMQVGEVRRIFIPAELGYGEKGNVVIPPNSPLIFETELVDLK